MKITPDALLFTILGLPLLACVGVLITRRFPNVREAVSLIVAAVLCFFALELYLNIPLSSASSVTLIELLPGLALRFKAEPLGVLFVMIASFLWLVTTTYAIGYMRGHHEKNQTRFFAFFALSISAVMAIALAENLFTLFVFYEVLTLATYPLVTHAGSDKARRGGRTYLSILLGTSLLFFLPALLGTWVVAGNLTFTPGGVFPQPTSPVLLSVLLALFVFGIGKAAVMPFHRWLPAAMVAPTPVSSLLHAVAVVKAGVFSIVKIVVFIFGINTVSELVIHEYLLYLLGFSIIAASLVAMRQNNLKARLAYSTISQLAYVSLGALLAVESGIVGSAMHIAMHACGKITLFFCAGAIMVAAHKTEISDMAGLGRQMPITMAAFFIGALSIIGLPPTGGAWSKWYLLLATVETQHWVLMAVLMLSSLLNIAYLLPIPLRGFFPAKGEAYKHSGIKEAPLPSLIAIVITSLLCLLLFLFPNPLLKLAETIGA